MKTFFQVLLLIDRGADVNKKTAFEESCLWLALAIPTRVKSLVKILLENNANVNEMHYDESILDKACSFNDPELLHLLLKHGANLYDPLKNYCNIYSSKEKKSIFKSRLECLAKELALLKFEENALSIKNLKYLREGHFGKLSSTYIDCLNELKMMKNHELCDGLTAYDVFKLRNDQKKLILLLKNRDFVFAYRSPRNIRRFRLYRNELINVFKNALKKTNILLSQEKKIFDSNLDKKFSMPPEIVGKIAYLACKDSL